MFRVDLMFVCACVRHPADVIHDNFITALRLVDANVKGECVSLHSCVSVLFVIPFLFASSY